MLTQTLAIFHDAYRELNSKKLFWITLILSALLMAGFGLLGIKDENTLTLLTVKFPMPMARFAYKQVFDWVVVWFWFTIVAIVLALVSTGGLFPDFISSGAIDLYISKPISRLRLFLTKYLAGLLFVLLQLTVFAVVSFFVFGIRAGEWKPGLFWAIPLVLAMFSYLFAVCVFLGVWTRSTIAALLLTMLVWALLFALHKSEETVLMIKLMNENAVQRHQKTKADATKQLAALEANPPASDKLRESRRKFQQDRIDRANTMLSGEEPSTRKLEITHRIMYDVKTILPKTSETTNMIERWLFTEDELMNAMEKQKRDMDAAFKGEGGEEFAGMQNAGMDTQLATRHRSPLWIVGTSLAFEAGVLALAAWIFCRRDY
jgi:ABC-type transport system involved in multi-copper enzyme maturation permease subunit